MSLIRKEKKPTLGERLGGMVMTLAVMILLGGLVCAFVVAGVYLLNPSEGKGKAVPIAQGSAPTDNTTTLRPSAALKAAPENEQPGSEDPRQIAAAPKLAPAPKAKPAPVAIDDKGYIRQWILLGPIPCDKEINGAKEISYKQIRNESKPKVRPGLKERTKKGDFVWFEYSSPEYFVDFKKAVKGKRSEDVVGYAVCYLRLKDSARELRLEMRSNDQALVYLNGSRILRQTQSRTIETGVDVYKKVRLKKGVNVLVLKVINEKNNWQGSIRITDQGGSPFRDYEVAVTP